MSFHRRHSLAENLSRSFRLLLGETFQARLCECDPKLYSILRAGAHEKRERRRRRILFRLCPIVHSFPCEKILSRIARMRPEGVQPYVEWEESRKEKRRHGRLFSVMPHHPQLSLRENFEQNCTNATRRRTTVRRAGAVVQRKKTPWASFFGYAKIFRKEINRFRICSQHPIRS